MQALGLSTSSLAAYGVKVEECDTFCSEGVAGCTTQCREAEQDCELCSKC